MKVIAADDDFSEKTFPITILNQITPILLIPPTSIKLAVNLVHCYEIIGDVSCTEYSWIIRDSVSQNEITTGFTETEKKLTLEANILSPATSYELEYEIFTSTGYALLTTTFETSGEIDISNASVSVTPSEGTALSTDFVIEATEFIDEEGEDLTYKFYYILNDIQTLMGENDSGIFTCNLP